MGTENTTDAEKVADRPELFDFFIFATTQNPAAIKRDRVEQELEEEYGWRVRVWDFERLRNRLMGDNENHDLAIEHLSVTPGKAFEDVSEKVDGLYNSFIQRLHSRKAPSGTIQEDVPLVAVHLIPIEALEESHNRIAMELPDPPAFNSQTAITEQIGRVAVTGHPRDLVDESFEKYVAFHSDGWMEAVSTGMTFIRDGGGKIKYLFDPKVVDFVKQALDCYESVEILPPLYLYITLIDTEEYIMSHPRRMWGPDSPRQLETEEFCLNRITLNGYDVDIPSELRRSFYLLWNQLGWQTGSIHYDEEEDDETGEKYYEWNPHS